MRNPGVNRGRFDLWQEGCEIVFPRRCSPMVFRVQFGVTIDGADMATSILGVRDGTTISVKTSPVDSIPAIFNVGTIRLFLRFGLGRKASRATEVPCRAAMGESFLTMDAHQNLSSNIGVSTSDIGSAIGLTSGSPTLTY